MNPAQTLQELQEIEQKLCADWLAFYSKKQVVKLTGADVRSWLQGQITADVRDAMMWRGNWCKPTGQLLAITFGVFTDPKTCLIWGDDKALEVVIERAQKMVILEDVSAERKQVESIEFVGAKASSQHEIAKSTFKNASFAEFGAINPGSFEIVQLESSEDSLENLHLGNFSAKLISASFSIDSYRILSKTPSFQDQEEKTLPPEFGEVFENQTISYQKGCYTGQEILMRMHSRGHTNRVWRALRWSGEIKQGDEILNENREKIGSVTYAVNSPSWGWLSGAMIHRNAIDLDHFASNNAIGKVID